MKCELCNCKLLEKNEIKYGTKGAECHISRHHYFPKRFKKFFNNEEIKRVFGINNKNDVTNLCYSCHEELIHNIILNSKIINKLNKKMSGKDIKERIIILYKQLLK
jgi:hypothetical protein